MGFVSRQRKDIFSLLHNAQTASKHHPASYTMGTPGIKRPGSEAHHSFLPSDEVNNGGAIPPLTKHLNGVVLK
jgi:hypothetical protein